MAGVYCPSCEGSVEPAAKFCLSCGNDLTVHGPITATGHDLNQLKDVIRLRDELSMAEKFDMIAKVEEGANPILLGIAAPADGEEEMIGEEAEINTIFTSRINTKRSATIIDQFEDTDNDYVTSRIMWLDGEEDGLNKGGNVDSFRRYIYIHGTHEEGLIGTKASHGCIRLFNYDVIELFNLVNIGTKVLIRA